MKTYIVTIRLLSEGHVLHRILVGLPNEMSEQGMGFWQDLVNKTCLSGKYEVLEVKSVKKYNEMESKLFSCPPYVEVGEERVIKKFAWVMQPGYGRETVHRKSVELGGSDD
jgi:hypothetical protein